MEDETSAAVEAATGCLEWAIGLLEGELAKLPKEEALREATVRLRKVSPVAAEALDMAGSDIREHGLDQTDHRVLRKIAGLYVEDVIDGIFGAPPV